jgi:putative toxin-antitoxin system antitoxin component (TIGR02293 family)
MTWASETNVEKIEQPDIRLFALLALWSDLVAALRKEGPAHHPGDPIDLATWRAHSTGRSFPASLYRMTEGATARLHASHNEDPFFELIDTIDAGSVDYVLARDVKAALIRAVDELPPQERSVIALFYFERLSLKEIRGALNVSESSVSQIHARAVKHLRFKVAALLQSVQQGTKEVSPDFDTSLHEVLYGFHQISPERESMAIRNGLSANTWNALQLLGFDRAEIASVVDSSEKTIHRKVAMSETLGVAEGDRTMRLIRVMLHSFEAFGNVDKALTWLRRKNRVMRGQTPLEMLMTEAGTALIRRALGVIEYGGVA